MSAPYGRNPRRRALASRIANFAARRHGAVPRPVLHDQRAPFVGAGDRPHASGARRRQSAPANSSHHYRSNLEGRSFNVGDVSFPNAGSYHGFDGLRSISQESREIAKRLIIDALACGIGGYRSPTGRAALKYATKVSQSPEATLIGSGERVSASAAIIANQAMWRYLDYNDDLPIPIGPGDLVAAHPSGALPVALAVAEKTNASGRR